MSWSKEFALSAVFVVAAFSGLLSWVAHETTAQEFDDEIENLRERSIPFVLGKLPALPEGHAYYQNGTKEQKLVFYEYRNGGWWLGARVLVPGSGGFLKQLESDEQHDLGTVRTPVLGTAPAEIIIPERKLSLEEAEELVRQGYEAVLDSEAVAALLAEEKQRTGDVKLTSDLG